MSPTRRSRPSSLRTIVRRQIATVITTNHSSTITFSTIKNVVASRAQALAESLTIQASADLIAQSTVTADELSYGLLDYGWIRLAEPTARPMTIGVTVKQLVYQVLCAELLMELVRRHQYNDTADLTLDSLRRRATQ